jgi:hypothetical protein
VRREMNENMKKWGISEPSPAIQSWKSQKTLTYWYPHMKMVFLQFCPETLNC